MMDVHRAGRSRGDGDDRDIDGRDTSSKTPATTTLTTETNTRSSAGASLSDVADPSATERYNEDNDYNNRSHVAPVASTSDSAWGKHWQWVPYSLRRTGSAIARWSRGPQPPRRYRIKPFFPRVQEFPLRLVQRFLPRREHRWLVVFLYLSIWTVTFALVKRQGRLATEIADYGQPVDISCGDTYWGPGNNCGLDGDDCRPFNGTGFAFRCPGNCASYHVLNPRAVGDQEIVYRALIVGGPDSDLKPDLATYRGDSYICGAAIHAGIVSNANGGCGVLRLIGQGRNYISSQRNGITSIGFDSYFPLSYQFVPGVECKSSDSRWSLLAVSTVFTGILSLFTNSPALFFFPIFIGVFATTGLAMDSPTATTFAGLVSNELGKLLPALFVAWVMFDKMGVRRTLQGLTAQVEKAILWLGACWVGALTNYTLDFIPISRLTSHDLNQQPGAKAALAVIVIVLFFVVVFQVWYFRQEGRFVKYIKLYALLVFAIVIALVMPDLNLRIHHYILALLLLPGTSIQTRPSLLYQGLLVGLFINGIARWGFDSVLQTSAALQGDAQKGSLLPHFSTDPLIHWANSSSSTSQSASVSNITFQWASPSKQGYDGISILVNDVERYRSYFDEAPHPPNKFTWDRNSTLELPEYFRFAFMMGSDVGDYTKAGVWTADGQWKQMAAGPSKV